MPRGRSSAPTAATGCTAPVSLLAAITETEPGIAAQGRRHGFGPHHAVPVGIDPGDRPAFGLELAESLQHGRVLEGGRHEVASLQTAIFR